MSEPVITSISAESGYWNDEIILGVANVDPKTILKFGEANLPFVLNDAQDEMRFSVPNVSPGDYILRIETAGSQITVLITEGGEALVTESEEGLEG